jgi:hypothetical protein
VNNGSGIKQVDGEPNQLETLASGKVVAKKNGYVYVYTSNESTPTGADMRHEGRAWRICAKICLDYPICTLILLDYE